MADRKKLVYEKKHRLDEHHYIAEVSRGGKPYALIVVTTDDSGKDIKFAIFGKQLNKEKGC